MFAVIKTGGKQYKVAEGDEIVVEKLDGDAGADVTFGDVLMLGDGGKVTIGEPLVAGASVIGEVAEQRKGDKVLGCCSDSQTEGAEDIVTLEILISGVCCWHTGASSTFDLVGMEKSTILDKSIPLP